VSTKTRNIDVHILRMAKRDKGEEVSDYSLTVNKPIAAFTPQVPLESAALVVRFLRRSISSGGQCAYCFVEESTASFANDVSFANKQLTTS
jgi:hypothetical protein